MLSPTKHRLELELYEPNGFGTIETWYIYRCELATIDKVVSVLNSENSEI